MHPKRLVKALQWNLFITDMLVQEGLSIIKRCPLLRGLCKNISATHTKYYYDDKSIKLFMRHVDNDFQML